jgi:hypothetical protein
VRGDALWLCLSVFYAVLLAASWRADTLELMFPVFMSAWPPLPRLTGIAAMFSRPASALAAWVHLLALDLFVARFVFLDAARHTPRVPAAHSLVACMMFGPSGLLSHALTLLWCQHAARRRAAKAAAAAAAAVTTAPS